MIPAALYQTVYLLIVTVLTIYVMSRYKDVNVYTQERYYYSNYNFVVALAVIIILFIGLRPPTWDFGDTGNYARDYKIFLLGKEFSFNWDTENVIFDNIFALWGSMRLPIKYFFFFISFVYFGGMLLGCKKMFPNDTLLVFLVYLGAFSSYGAGVNGIKAGAAASLFFMALSYKRTEMDSHILRKLLPFGFLLLSLGFHHSMAAPLAAFVIALFVRKREYYLCAWIFALVMAALHVTFFQELFAGLTDDRGADYLRVTQEFRAVSGFRPDFILYSCIPIFLGDYIIRKYEIESEEYDFIWSVYTFLNAIFLLCTYASFINRIAYLSWGFYPIVLIYPFLKFSWHPEQNRYLRYVVYGHLGFTLFMSFVYYA